MALSPQAKKGAATAAATLLVLAGLGGVEGNRLTAYRDAVGIVTICKGNTHGVVPGMTLTQAECDQIDKGNATAAVEAVWDSLDDPSSLPPATIAAFADFQFNTGKFTSSTARNLVNRGYVADGCRDLYRWVYAGRPPRRLQGLWNRRDYEVQMCLKDLKP